MGKRHDSLDLLTTSFKCQQPWEEMSGSGSCRFCSSCQREVYDFALMTPGQIRARLEANRGQLCARLTREGGRLRVLEVEEALAPSRQAAAFRISPLAATLFGAWLGASAVAAQPAAEPQRAGVAAVATLPEPAQAEAEVAAGHAGTLSGRLLDQNGNGVRGAVVLLDQLANGRQREAVSNALGSFTFEGLPQGVYDLRAELAGFEIAPSPNLWVEAGTTREAELEAIVQDTVIAGALLAPSFNLRQLFAYSDLVTTALVEGSTVVAVERGLAEVHTRLRIEKCFKCDANAATVTYRHFEPEATLSSPAGGLATGERLLVFLSRTRDRSSSSANGTFSRVDFHQSFRNIEKEKLGPYLERVEALALLENKKSGVVPHLVDLTEWLVATAELADTRDQAIFELESGLTAFAELARKEGKDPALLAQDLRLSLEDSGGTRDRDLRPIFLGAAISTEQQERLSAALLATEPFAASNFALYRAVRGWDPNLAQRWLVKALSSAKVTNGYATYWLLRQVADSLPTPEVKTFKEAAEARWQAMEDLDFESETYQDGTVLESKRQDLARELLRELGAIVARQ